VAGAVFLDGGWAAAYDLVILLFRDAPVTGEILSRAGDAKTGLQELCQKHCQMEPHYQLLSQSGPSHRPRFEVAVLLGEKVLAEGRGASKQKAEQDAAASAIDLIESTGGLQHPGDREADDRQQE
jgi:ribonuclease-3